MDAGVRPCGGPQGPSSVRETSKVIAGRDRPAPVILSRKKTRGYIRSMTYELQVKTISDDELLRCLREVLQQSRRVEAELVAHIGEVDARRLYAEDGRLHLSGIAKLAPHRRLARPRLAPTLNDARKGLAPASARPTPVVAGPLAPAQILAVIQRGLPI